LIMERPENSQLELFSKTGEPVRFRRRDSSPFLRRFRGYEKRILFLLGIALVSIISFTLGVERGKNLRPDNAAIQAVRQEPQTVPVAPAPAEVTPQAPVVIIREQKPQAQTKLTRELTQNGYTIQLASYKKHSSAQKEAQELRKKGLSPLILPKGNWIILCVGNFNQKKDAEILLLQLKKRYKDCTVRRL